MNLQAIVDFLQAAGHGVPGETLFRGFMPESESGLLVLSRTKISINPYVSGYRKGEFQVISRAGSNGDAESLLNGVIETLKTNGERNLSGVLFKRIWPIHEPLVYPKGDNKSVEASVNFDVAYIA